MNNTPLTQQLQDRFGRQVATRLADGAAELSYDITERLRAARVRAVARRKPTAAFAAPTVSVSGGAASLTFGESGLGPWGRIGAALPLVALVAGLVLIHTIQNDNRASEVAEVDAALLTDDLPPSAYADPGFAQFLKTARE